MPRRLNYEIAYEFLNTLPIFSANFEKKKSLFKCVPDFYRTSVFVDDFNICYRIVVI